MVARSRKNFVFASLLAFVSNAASQGILQQNVGEGLGILNSFNAFAYFPIQTYQDLAIFIATWIVTYAIALNFFEMIFEGFEDVVSDIDRYSTGDDYPTGIKLMAVGTSFVGVQIIGGFLGPLWLLYMMIIMMIVLTVAVTKFGWTFAGFSVSLPSFGGGNDGPNRTPAPGGSEGSGTEEGSEAEDAIEEGEDEEEQAETEAGEAEEREQSGDEETADREARDAAEHLKNALQDFEVAKDDINQLLDKDLEQLNRTLNELRSTLEEAEEEEEFIQRLAKFPGKLKQRIASIRNKIQGGQSVEWEDISQRDLMLLGYGSDEPTLLDIFDEMRDLNDLVEGLRKDLSSEKEEEDREERELSSEIKELMEAHKLIRRLKRDVDIAEHIDEDELDVLAQQIGDKKLHEEVGYEEEEEKQLLEDLQILVGKEEEVEKYLKKADELLARIMELDREEIQQIRAEEGNLSDAKTEFRNLERLISDEFGEPDDINIETPDRGQINLGQFLTSFEAGIESFESSLDEVLDMKAANEEEVEEISSYVEESIRQLEQS